MKRSATTPTPPESSAQTPQTAAGARSAETGGPELKVITLRGGQGIRAGCAFAGFIVPDTEELLAIDERHPANPDNLEEPEADWRITHIPTMYALNKPGYTDAATREQALAIAQCFYQEAKARGWPIESEDPAEFAAVFNAIPAIERTMIWNRLREAGEKVHPPEETR